MSMGELEEYVQSHSSVPEDPDIVYVPHSQIAYTEDSVTMRIYFTTKRLTSLMQKNNHISIDPTYKLIWQGYPVFMVGTTDMDKQYHPFGLAVCINEEQADFEFVFEALVKSSNEAFQFSYTPTILLADAACQITNAFVKAFGGCEKRIVCWVHVLRNCEKRLKENINKPFWLKIVADIKSLQLASNLDIFRSASVLFCNKWRLQVPDFIDNYFKPQWLDNNFGWFEGYALFIHSHNNALRKLQIELSKTSTLEFGHQQINGL